MLKISHLDVDIHDRKGLGFNISHATRKDNSKLSKTDENGLH